MLGFLSITQLVHQPIHVQKVHGKEQDLIKQLGIGIDEAQKQIRCCNEQCMDYLIQRKLARGS